VNVGIIGFGLMGQQRARNVALLPPHRLAAIYDPDQKKASAAAEQLGYAVESSYQALLERDDIKAVIVAVPHCYSRDIAVAALKASKHVFCEKPLGLNTQQCDDILQAAEGTGMRLAVGFNYRFYPGIQEARRRITDGDIGTPTHLRCVMGHGGRPGYENEWKTSKDLCGGGALLDPGIHIIDLIGFLMGEIRTGTASLYRTFWKIDVEDNAFLMLETAEGRQAQVHLSITEWKSKFALDIFGTEGSIHVRGRSGFYGAQSVRYIRRWEWLQKTSTGECMSHYPPEDVSFLSEMRAFFDSIEGQPSGDLASGEDGRAALSIIERLYQANPVKQIESLKPTEELLANSVVR
jgi:predicted dehydrogenase